MTITSLCRIAGRRFLALLFVLLLLTPFWYVAPPVAAANDGPTFEDHLHSAGSDALHPPAFPPALAADNVGPTRYEPSAFLAGRVVVQVLFVESDGGAEPSTEDWTPEQIAAIEGHVRASLDWWAARVPNANVSFDLISQVAPSRYEPIGHTLNEESLWIGDALARLGYAGVNHFDRAYAAADALRRAKGADWATTIFIANSAADTDGRFADGYFAYAYVGGPFLVLTSDAGPYGVSRMAPVFAHELGHIFGALDQYASAGTLCTQRSGYLAIPTTNSQANNCGTRESSIMLEPLSAYAGGTVDASALGQVGYRDSDSDSIPDPLDTVPALQASFAQPQGGGRPVVTGLATDQPYPSSFDTPTTVNTIALIEYRVDGGAWIALPAMDSSYDSALEKIGGSLPLYDGTHTVELRAVNSVGAASSIASHTVLVQGVGAAPAYTVEAPALTNTSTVALNLAAPAGSSVQLSKDPFFTGAAWMPFQEQMTWNVGASDGPHTVYVRFRDDKGIESPPFAQPVLVDQTPPTGRALLHSGTSPWIELQVQDSISGVVDMQIITRVDLASEWQPFQSALTLSSDVVNAGVQVRIRDAAGNISAPLLVKVGHNVYLPFIGS